MEEVEQKTENAVIEKDEKQVQVDATIKTKTDEEKMEVDTEFVIENAEIDVKPLTLNIESECEDIVNLKVEGIEIGDDDEEEFVVMSPEEIRTFLERKISEHVRDPQVNPLLALERRTQDLLDEIKDKAEEITKLGKALDMLYRNQEKFLRHMNIFPKVPTNSVSVSVDLPLLMDSVPLMSPSKAQDEEAVIRKDLSDAKVLSASFSRAKSSTTVGSSPVPNAVSITPTVPNAVSITPTVPKAVSITPTVPNAVSITPTVPNAVSITPTVPNAVSAAPTVSNSLSITPTVPKASSSALVSNLTTTIKSLPKLPPKPAGSSSIECIDLTDDSPAKNLSSLASISLVKHPAPLPPKPFSAPNSAHPNVPPKPRLKISSEDRGIVLQWDMPPCYSAASAYSKLKSFDIFGYQEQKNVVINTLLWKKIGAVKAMNLPMACTLTQFLEGQKYHFSIRAVDVYDRCGSYSDPISIVYKPNYLKKA